MRRLTYRLYVDAPDDVSEETLVQVVEDALEGLEVGALRVEYHQIGTASGLPDPEERR